MWMIAATLLAVAPPPGFSISIERLPVRAGPKAALVVDSLLGEVRLQGVTPTGKPAKLCPRQSKAGAALVLHCTTRRLWASLEKDARGAYVDLRELRSFSWFDPDARLPMHAFSLRTIGIPDSCPGIIAAARGECALARGDLPLAKKAWEEALTGPDLNFAHLRLGDLALADGDVEKAMVHWSKVVPVGPLGRLANARVCEVIGSCFDEAGSARAANDDTLPAEVARELSHYTLRRELVAGRDHAALELLTARLNKDADYCLGVPAFCQKMVEVGLRSDDTDARLGALAAFLNDSIRHGPREAQLNALAAETAAELGAPGFAAALLAGNSPRVDRKELPAHLLRIVKLYAAAGDRARGEVILEYADSKLGTGARTPAWNEARKALRTTTARSPQATYPSLTTDAAALDALTGQVVLTTELARATKARSQAVEDPREMP